MSRPTFFRPLLPIALIAALGGCSLLGSNERSAVTIYSPVVRIQADPSWPTVDWQLVLVKPSAARVVDSPRINVRPTPSELEVYKGVSWAQPATDMLDDALVRETKGQLILLHTKDFVEGTRAFQERRPAHFSGA